MNSIMLIIEYMNAIYALKKLDNNFYPATSSFCIRIISSNICLLYDIRLLVPWSGHSKVFCIVLWFTTGADPGFKIRGAHLKKLRRAEEGAKNFGVSRVKNHDFTPKNHIFFNFRGGGGRPGCPPPLVPPLR